MRYDLAVFVSSSFFISTDLPLDVLPASLVYLFFEDESAFPLD